MIFKDHNEEILKGFLKHPLKYGGFSQISLAPKSYNEKEIFFLYGVDSLTQFEELLKNRKALLILGFSYCTSPLNVIRALTPDLCALTLNILFVSSALFGKIVQAATPKQTIPLFIPTIHYIGGKIFENVHQNPGKPIVFMITACELTLEMFGRLGKYG